MWRIQARVHAARSRPSTGGGGHEEAIRALLRLDSPYVPTAPATPEPLSRRRGDAGESPGGWESLAAQGDPSKACAEGEGVKLLLAQERDRALAAEAQAQKAAEEPPAATGGEKPLRYSQTPRHQTGGVDSGEA